MASLDTNRTYKLPDAAEKADYVQRNFDEIATRYDLFNDCVTAGMHRLWKQKAIELCNLKNKAMAVAVDLCCGSGDVALRWEKHLGPDSRVIAVDFSEKMLDVLRSRAKRRHVDPSRLTIRQGNALHLDFLDTGSVDAVSIGFGLRNVSDRKACLAEILRILKPGGKLSILDTGKPESALLLPFYKFYFFQIVPRIGNLLQGKNHEMYSYLPASSVEYPSQQAMVEELCEAGFSSAHFRNLMFGAASIHIAVK